MTPDTDIERVESILAGSFAVWRFTVFDLMVLGVWAEHGRDPDGDLESCIEWIDDHPEKVVDL